MSLFSCADRQVESALDAAQVLYNAEEYAAADSVLLAIDARGLKPGSRQQSRYALLYTQTQYKQYIDAPNDSLITLAVDYAEADGDDEDRFYAYLYQGIVRYDLGDYSQAAYSLFRAMSNADDVEDYFSKGQMYSYLAQVNGEKICSDDVCYAQKACEEYAKSGLTWYLPNALSILSIAKCHLGELDSARIYVDSAICLAKTIQNEFALLEALSNKGQYAVMADSIQLAQEIYGELSRYDTLYSWQAHDLCNLAYIQALAGNGDSAAILLARAEELCFDRNDSVNFLIHSIWVYDALEDYQQSSEFKEQLINYEESLWAERKYHSALAEQKEYSEYKFILAKKQSRQRLIISVGLFISLVLLVLFFIIYYRNKTLQVSLQSEKIKKLQVMHTLKSKEIASGIKAIRTSEVTSRFHDISKANKIAGVEDWESMESLFARELPHFKRSLLELSSYSDIEMHLSMLLKLNFAPREIATLLGRTQSAITLARKRLFIKVFKKEGTASDWDNFIMSI